MAICASNYTFFDFLFGLSNAFCITNIKHFLAFDMVKMQSCVVSFVTTIYATVCHFIIPKPSTNLFSSIIVLFVDSFPITKFCKPLFSHFFTLYRVIYPVARLAIHRFDFIRVSFTPPLSGFSLLLFLKFCFHNYIIALNYCNVNSYPCKPDIFEQTYEPVEAEQ